MAEQKKQDEPQVQTASVKTNKDGFKPGEHVSPQAYSEFKLKQRKKAKQ